MPSAEAQLVDIKAGSPLRMLLHHVSYRENMVIFFNTGIFQQWQCMLAMDIFICEGFRAKFIVFTFFVLHFITSWTFGFGKVLIVWDNL